MIKIKLEHGKMYGDESPYGVRVTAINTANDLCCTREFSLTGLDRLSKIKLDALMSGIETAVEETIGVLRNTTAISGGV